MTAIAQHILDALSVGSTYALLALGLALVFSVMGFINFSYGMLIVWAGYALAVAPSGVVGITLAVFAATGLSVLTGYVAFRPFLKASPTILLITSFGVQLALQAIAVLKFGDDPRVLSTPSFLQTVWHPGGLRVPAASVAAIALAVLVVAGLHLVLHRTSFGLQLRATAEDRSVAQLLGITPGRAVLIAFAISGFIAGLVSILWFAKLGTVAPRTDLNPTLDAFIAIVLGGLGSIRGAVVGGLALGAVETTLSFSLPPNLIVYDQAAVFLILILVLLVRPSGLVGKVVDLSR